ncbi:MAG: methylthioribulose 1-phosphate dehydratase [Candidatus Eremiobacteraeota bacterium]|nr:methylthioribulose 1-phosphate dehydratase [Candidatus Eremiobacteraeota bacterium]
MQIDPQAATELAALGRFAHEHGWVPATSGNFSRRLDANHIAVTRSGANKGDLNVETDLIVVALDRPLPAGVSAETPLHVARYRRDPGIGAIAHVHSVAATVLSRADEARGHVAIEGFEMQKAITGFTTHESLLRLPVFENAQDTEALARRIEHALAEDVVSGTPAYATVPGYLLAGHGMYAWGATIDDTRRHIEGLDFLLRCVLEERRLTQ